MRIAILHDAVTEESRPDEIDALRQAEFVGKALGELGHEGVTTGVSLDLQGLSDTLHQFLPDVVFNLVESLAGHGRLMPVLPAVLEAWGIPFTGSGSSACLLTTDKPLAKAWLTRNRVPTPPWRCPHVPAIMDLTPPCVCIIKPAREDASVGIDDHSVIHVARNVELDQVLETTSPRVEDVFAEQFLEGREFNLSLLADGHRVEVLPVAEIEFVDYPPDKPRIVGYAAKWDEASFEYGATPRRFDFADSDQALLEKLRSLAVKCWRLFGLRGYARVDFRVDESHRPWVIEVNVNPCLAPDAGFVAATQRRGLTPKEVIARIVAASVPQASRKERAESA